MERNEIMLGNLMASKMREFETRRRFVVSDEFYELSLVEQDELIMENRRLKLEIDALKIRINKLSEENKSLTDEIAQLTHDGTLWLGDVLRKENPKFGSNNLIISPVGSGKTYAITELLAPKGSKVQLLLVSTTHLKNSIAPDILGDKKRIDDGINVFTTRNRASYGNRENKLWVMTYAEFGKRIEVNEDFLVDNGITDIYCDEIHSLIEYKWFSGSEALIVAMRYLLQKTEGITKYYFTATTEYLRRLQKENATWFTDIKVFNYSRYPGIKKYTAMNESNFGHIEQLREQLRNHNKDFRDYGKKGLFFSSKISTLKNMESLLVEEGFRPLVLWSTNNEQNIMSEEQLRALEELVETEEIPAGYDFLLINGAMREGWNLKDKNVELVIVNSTSETDIIQARGRVRKNVSTLLLRANSVDIEEDLEEILVPREFLNTPLTAKGKDELRETLSIVNDRGKLSGWVVIKRLLEAEGYKIEETVKRIDGKRKRITVISK